MLKTGDFDKKTYEQITKQEPVVGYGGFLKGVKAENQYGVSYKELAKKSIQSWSISLLFHKISYLHLIRNKLHAFNKNFYYFYDFYIKVYFFFFTYIQV